MDIVKTHKPNGGSRCWRKSGLLCLLSDFLDRGRRGTGGPLNPETRHSRVEFPSEAVSFRHLLRFVGVEGCLLRNGTVWTWSGSEDSSHKHSLSCAAGLGDWSQLP